jgi:hypothetical protein
VSATTFRRKTATTDGGGMFNGYHATVSASTFDHNSAGTDGIGIGNGFCDFGTGPVSVTGSHFTGNHAAAHGGGQYPGMRPMRWR